MCYYFSDNVFPRITILFNLGKTFYKNFKKRIYNTEEIIKTGFEKIIPYTKGDVFIETIKTV